MSGDEELSGYILKASCEALKVLREALKSSDEVVRVAAAEAILNHCNKIERADIVRTR